jgi:hypothetical protein
MDPDGAAQLVLARDLERLVTRRDVRGDRDNLDVGLQSAPHDVLAIGVKLRAVEMGVTVNEHYF